MLALSLRKKFIFGTMLLILFVGGALGLLVRYELHNRLEIEVHKRGLSIARYLAEASEIPLITENRISLQQLVNDYRRNDRDIDYIYIVDPHNTILVHTFKTAFPAGLQAAAGQQTDTAGKFVPFEFNNDTLYAVSIPIQNGALGTVHVGLYESVIMKNVNGVLSRMFPFVMLILGISTLGALLFASAITRPIALLTEGAYQVSQGDLDHVISVVSRDEIGQLATAFNQMTENLRLTTVSRQFMEKLINTMNEVLVVLSPEGEVLSVNRTYCEMFGSVPEKVIGRRLTDFAADQAPPVMFAAFLKSQVDGRAQGIECFCSSGVGKQIPLLLSLAVMRDENGESQAVICAAQDISAIKQFQHELYLKQTELERLNQHLEEQVASRTAELAITNEGLRAEVTERQRTAEELRYARDVAESANRSKSEFLANMSHEMRTPLNSIIGGSEYLENAIITEDQRSCLDMIRRAGDGLLMLVNDLIDLSRIEAGQLELSFHEFNLADTLENVYQMMMIDARRKSLDFTLKMTPDVPHFVIGDQVRLQQVLINLAANAIKFTGTGGLVSISALPDILTDDSVMIDFVVRDTGIGIETEKLGMIFDSFTQADASITRRFGGSGLGLAISRRLVEAMGGSFMVESEPDKGSSFMFSLQFSIARNAVGTMKTDISGMNNHDVSLHNDAGEIQHARLLLVDDALENRALMRLVLSKQPLIIDEASNGSEAVAMFEQNEYDLVLMDVQMPVMDGYTATRLIREIEQKVQGRRTPVIALTAHAYEDDIRKSRDAGCDDHIAKPFKKKTLLNCLNRHLGGKCHEH